MCDSRGTKNSSTRGGAYDPFRLRKVQTRDGSSTLYSEHFHQHYHNLSGAQTESRHVFFEQTGLLQAITDHRKVTVFEVGYGSGFHLLLLEVFRRMTASRSTIHYLGVEKFPVEGEVFRSMELEQVTRALSGPAQTIPSGPGAFSDIIDTIAGFNDRQCRADSGSTISVTLSDLPAGTQTMHTESDRKSPESNPATGGFTRATVYRGDFSDRKAVNILTGTKSIDFFLHDAFSPAANPDLWTVDVFSNLLATASEEAMLGTYCSATKARAAMVLAGWHVARAAGPPGKREMTLASPSGDALSGFKRVNEQRLRERFQDELAS